MGVFEARNWTTADLSIQAKKQAALVLALAGVRMSAFFATLEAVEVELKVCKVIKFIKLERGIMVFLGVISARNCQ